MQEEAMLRPQPLTFSPARHAAGCVPLQSSPGKGARLTFVQSDVMTEVQAAVSEVLFERSSRHDFKVLRGSKIIYSVARYMYG